MNYWIDNFHMTENPYPKKPKHHTWKIVEKAIEAMQSDWRYDRK